MKAKPQIALVLTGGGARGAYQAGFLHGLSEILPQSQLPFSILTGVSVGSINAAFLACCADNFQEATAKLWAMWANLKPEGVFVPKRGVLFKNGFRWLSQLLLRRHKTPSEFLTLLDNQPLRNLLLSELDFQAAERHLHAGTLRAVAFTAVDYSRGQSVTFFDGSEEIEPWKKGERLGRRTQLSVDHVIGSAALPILFESPKIDGNYYGDGSVRLTAPLSSAIHLGADKILVIATHAHGSKELPHEPQATLSFSAIMGTLLRSGFSDALDSDMERLEAMNRFALACPDQKEFRNIPALELRPGLDLGKLAVDCCGSFAPSFMRLLGIVGATEGQDHSLLSYLSFDKHYTVPLLEAGYQDALLAKTQIESFVA